MTRSIKVGVCVKKTGSYKNNCFIDLLVLCFTNINWCSVFHKVIDVYIGVCEIATRQYQQLELVCCAVGMGSLGTAQTNGASNLCCSLNKE